MVSSKWSASGRLVATVDDLRMIAQSSTSSDTCVMHYSNPRDSDHPSAGGELGRPVECGAEDSRDRRSAVAPDSRVVRDRDGAVFQLRRRWDQGRGRSVQEPLSEIIRGRTVESGRNEILRSGRSGRVARMLRMQRHELAERLAETRKIFARKVRAVKRPQGLLHADLRFHRRPPAVKVARPKGEPEDE